MPDISVDTQIFDLAFHPTESIVFVSLLTGHVKAFGYDEQGNHSSKFTVWPSKRSCRALAIDEDGSRLWAAGKGKALHAIDVSTGEVLETRAGTHEAPINRLKHLTPNLFSSGDDDGVVKLWDPRKPDAIRAYTHHFDFISDFLWLPDGKQLVTTSGDGTLSVIDVRAKKMEPLAQSEDQEDELLSIVPIRGGQKFVVGTQLGILSIFNKRSGWGDCVDRIPGHPHSIDTLCTLPSSYATAQSTVLTGSSDGLLRAVQLFPTKLLGVVADHNEFPIERIAVDRGGEGRWVGSAGHLEVLKLTDLKEVFEDDDGDMDNDGENGEDSDEDGAGITSEDGGDDDDDDKDEKQETAGSKVEAGEAEGEDAEVKDDEDSGEDEDAKLERNKRKRKKDKDPLQATKKRKGKNEIEGDRSFFADL